MCVRLASSRSRVGRPRSRGLSGHRIVKETPPRAAIVKETPPRADSGDSRTAESRLAYLLRRLPEQRRASQDQVAAPEGLGCRSRRLGPHPRSPRRRPFLLQGADRARPAGQREAVLFRQFLSEGRKDGVMDVVDDPAGAVQLRYDAALKASAALLAPRACAPPTQGGHIAAVNAVRTVQRPRRHGDLRRRRAAWCCGMLVRPWGAIAAASWSPTRGTFPCV